MKEKMIKDFTKGDILTQLWNVAWPIMLSIFFYTMYNLVDTFWVSKISTDSIAAVGISQLALMVMMALSMGISVGSSVLVSMNIGGGNKKEASRVMAQSFVLATILGIIFTIISLLFKEQILTISGAIGSIYVPALEYFTVVAAGSLLLFYMMNIIMSFNAEGDTFTVTKLFAVSTVVNIILDPIFIFGKFGFPEMGIVGAAYATLISQALFIIISMLVLSSNKRSVSFSFKNLSLRLESVKKVFDIGIPAAFTQVVNPIGLAILTYLVSSKFLEAGATSFSLVFRLEFFAYLPAVGFAMAAMSLIGQNMGAGNFDRANEIFKKASIMGFSTAIVLGALLVIFGRQLVEIFTTDSTVISYSLSYLWIVALTYGFLSLSMIIASSFQAMGKSWPGFWLIFIKFFIIVVPISYIAIKHYDGDIWLVWLALALGNIVVAIIGYIWNQKNFKKTIELKKNS